ncbi:MAG: c-type cytochrome domain-containing protein [Saprospiraceae bacterium]
MIKSKNSIVLGLFCILLFVAACKTDPIIPAGGLTTPPGPTVIDPGDDDLCANDTISFQHQVLPIMISACAYSGCHDAITAEDGIVLDNYENVIKEVKPGDPNDSELYESIVENDPDDIMPPPPADPLTAEQIKVVKDWINQGAKNTDCGAPCDSTASSFSVDIMPLLVDYCIGCHNTAREEGGVNIESYDKIIPYVTSGSLIGTIVHDPLYAKMPPRGSQLSNCRVAKIQKWINEGALNN